MAFAGNSCNIWYLLKKKVSYGYYNYNLQLILCYILKLRKSYIKKGHYYQYPLEVHDIVNFIHVDQNIITKSYLNQIVH